MQSRESEETKPRILTPTFAVLSGATLCFFLSMGILIPTVPKFLKLQGSAPLVLGFAAGAMSLAAILFRPLVGREIDRSSRKAFTALGLALSAGACALYPLLPGTIPILAVRVLHGAAIACFYPGASTLTADISPPSRRAEALSYFSMFLYAGTAAGPAIAEYVIAHYGYRATFNTSAVLAATGFFISLFLVETPREKTDESHRAPLLHSAAAFPALILGLCAVSFAAISVYVPLYAAERRGGNTTSFFFLLAITVIVLRFFVGKAADKYGRAFVIVPGAIICGLSMATIATSSSKAVLAVGAVLYGIGWGGLFPGLLAMTVDRVIASERGSATGTFTAAFDAAFGSAAFFLGVVLQVAGYRALFGLAGISCLSAGILFMARRSRSDAVFPSLDLD